MKNWKRIFYGIASAVGLAMFFVSILPIYVGVIHVGVIIPAACGLLVAIYSLLSLKYPMEDIPWRMQQTDEYRCKLEKAKNAELNRDRKFRRSILLGMKGAKLNEGESRDDSYVPGMLMSREKRVVIDRVLWILVAFAIVVTAGISSLMINGFERYDDRYNGETVVVLGARVNGNKPSLPLKKRLDGALEVLKKNPEAKCIVTGGKGKDETAYEADVMKSYIVSAGVDESRIFSERKSTSTIENLEFARDIIKENNLSENIIIITEFYHQYRAGRNAREIGLNSRGYSVSTRGDLFFSYWMREVMALTILMAKW